MAALLPDAAQGRNAYGIFIKNTLFIRNDLRIIYERIKLPGWQSSAQHDRGLTS